MGCPAKKAGFTLVELLVVISIIALLMSILMPALSSARRSGQSVVCMSNLKQLQLGWLMFANGNDDRVCQWLAVGDTSSFSPEYNTDLAIEKGPLWPYTGNVELYKCPSNKGWINRTCFLSISLGNHFRKLSYIDHPGQRAIILEGDHLYAPGVIAPLQTLNMMYAPVNVYNQNLWGGNDLAIRHNKGFNLSFADGHVEHYTFRDIRTIKYFEGEMSTEDASVNNNDLKQLKRWTDVVKAYEYAESHF
ncbi:prepilin-type N-terminal cleavage/methylation domain-containing protein [Planctomycetota bacterium]